MTNLNVLQDDKNRTGRSAKVVIVAGAAGALMAGWLHVAGASGPAECDPNIEVCTPVEGTVPTLPAKGGESTTTTTEVPTTSTTEAPTTTTTVVPPTTPEVPPVTQPPAVPVAPHTM